MICLSLSFFDNVLRNFISLLQIQVLVLDAWGRWMWLTRMIRIWWFAIIDLLPSNLSPSLSACGCAWVHMCKLSVLKTENFALTIINVWISTINFYLPTIYLYKWWFTSSISVILWGFWYLTCRHLFCEITVRS